MQNSQEHFKAIVHAKFGRQTERVMDTGNWKTENEKKLFSPRPGTQNRSIMSMFQLVL